MPDVNVPYHTSPLHMTINDFRDFLPFSKFSRPKVAVFSVLSLPSIMRMIVGSIRSDGDRTDRTDVDRFVLVKVKKIRKTLSWSEQDCAAIRGQGLPKQLFAFRDHSLETILLVATKFKLTSFFF